MLPDQVHGLGGRIERRNRLMDTSATDAARPARSWVGRSFDVA